MPITSTPSNPHLATRLVQDGWCPEAIQEKTGMSFEAVLEAFLAVPDRARQWGLTNRPTRPE